MRFTLLSFLTILILGLSSCSKCDNPCDIACDNFDPCCHAETVSANFRVRPGDRGFAPPPEWCDLLPTDTFNASSVRFDIPLDNPASSTYEWQIGTEPEPRTQESFEISFHNYLKQVGWETSIPVTLNVRTPLNACWENPGDTLITVTRELFFTEEQLDIYSNDSIVSYKGYFNGSNNEKTLTFFHSKSKGFRGEKAPVTLLIGTPIMDTLMMPKGSCGFDYCYNRIHAKWQFYNVERCSDSPLTNYMTGSEWILIEQEIKIKHILYFKNSPTLKFTGVKI